jgi:hypothetical protein
MQANKDFFETFSTYMALLERIHCGDGALFQGIVKM